MTVIVRPSGGRWAGVDYSGNQSVTNTAVEQDMANAGFAKWAPGYGPDLLVPLQARVTAAGVETVEDPNTPGGILSTSGGVAGSAKAAAAKAIKYDMPIWRKAVANARAGVAPALVTYNGDSKTAGQGAGSGASGVTGARAKSAPAQTAVILNQRFHKTSMDSWAGDQNISVVAGYSGQPTAGAGYNLYDPTIVAAGGTAWNPDSAPSTFGGRFWIGTNGGTGTLSMTPAAAAADTVVLGFARTASSSTAVPVTINGVAKTAINTQSGANDAALTTYTGVTSGAIALGGPTGGQAFFIGGYAYQAANPGIVMMQGGQCGQKISALAYTVQGYASLRGMLAFGPKMCILKATTNDVIGATSVVTYTAFLVTWVTYVQAAGSDALLVIDTPGIDTHFTDGTYAALIAAIYSVASTYSVNVLDLRDVLGSDYATLNAGGYAYDTIAHSTALGYGVEAEAVAAVLMSV